MCSVCALYAFYVVCCVLQLLVVDIVLSICCVLHQLLVVDMVLSIDIPPDLKGVRPNASVKS